MLSCERETGMAVPIVCPRLHIFKPRQQADRIQVWFNSHPSFRWTTQNWWMNSICEVKRMQQAFLAIRASSLNRIKERKLTQTSVHTGRFLGGSLDCSFVTGRFVWISDNCSQFGCIYGLWCCCLMFFACFSWWKFTSPRNQTMASQGDSLAIVRGLSNPGIFRPRGSVTSCRPKSVH